MTAQLKPVQEIVEQGYFSCSRTADSEALRTLHSTEKQPKGLWRGNRQAVAPPLPQLHWEGNINLAAQLDDHWAAECVEPLWGCQWRRMQWGVPRRPWHCPEHTAQLFTVRGEVPQSKRKLRRGLATPHCSPAKWLPTDDYNGSQEKTGQGISKAESKIFPWQSTSSDFFNKHTLYVYGPL